MTDSGCNETTHEFHLDLTRDEARRQAEVISALGDGWDPLEVIEGERTATRMLYSGLDADQLAVYRALVAAGVLPAPDAEDGNGAG